MTDIALGLGANLGNREQTIHSALEALNQTPGLTLLERSRFYETEPWGVVDQPRFLNICALFTCKLEPFELLEICKGIESQIGRTASVRWGPREIDIDILTYGDHTCNEPDLHIPHINMLNREFVLAPLAEIAPNIKVGGVSIADHLARLLIEQESSVQCLEEV